jgi:hypothetical protein
MATMDPRRPRRFPEAELWALPRVLAVDFRSVKFDVPRTYFVGRERRQTSEALEIMVRTASPLPIRALSPAIYVGDLPVEDYEVAGHNLYRFLMFDIGGLRAGAPISLGWPGRPVATRIALAARYRPTVA